MLTRFRKHKETESVDGVQAIVVLVDKPTMSALDMERVRRIFEIFDSDKDGSINKQQLLCAVHSLGYKYRIELLCTVTKLGSASKFDLLEFEGFVQKLDQAEMLGLKCLSGTDWIGPAKD
jgi:Ca2+-binding EF-hand superfamily protein